MATYVPNRDERAEYPEIKERIGEDPARFLDREVDTTTTVDLAVSRIRGIRSLEVALEWIKVEADLDRGPRKKVMALLNRKKQLLEDGVVADLDEGDVGEVIEA